MTIDRRRFLGAVTVPAVSIAAGTLRADRALAIAAELSQTPGSAHRLASDSGFWSWR